ncbi:MAG: SDR family NAD(P)-dependent oxidoreductase [Anaerolineaceae bacterium]|nr:SDR family NAD(P)-dependent oxidoreductase [Anaerolineaceae bacterium]
MKVEIKRFVGQVAVVTGGAKGIGGACADRFAQEGARVACLDVIDDVNEQHAAELRAQGVDAIALHCDVANPESVKAAVEAVTERWGRIDILVAAAGIYTGSPLVDVSFKQWQRLIDIDLTGVFLCNQTVAPIMMKQKSGSIINISSMAGKTSWSCSAEYSSAKSGVIGLTRAVAMDMAPYSVTVNAICPGNTLTDMVTKDVAPQVGGRDGLAPDQWIKMRTNDCPLKRIAEPWEMGGVAAFLASEDARYITGQSIEVDGGLIMS